MDEIIAFNFSKLLFAMVLGESVGNNCLHFGKYIHDFCLHFSLFMIFVAQLSPAENVQIFVLKVVRYSPPDSKNLVEKVCPSNGQSIPKMGLLINA